MDDTPRVDKLFDMVSEREGPTGTGRAPSRWSYEAILDLTDFARKLERELAAAKAELADKHQQLCNVQSDFEDMHDRAEEAERKLADADSRLQGYAKAVQDLTENQLLQDSATAAVMERAERAEAELAACREDAEKLLWEAIHAFFTIKDSAEFSGCSKAIDAARKEGA